MKKNILTLITSSYGGGAERLVLNQMKFFDSNKFNQHVITFRPGQLEEEFKKTNAIYHTLNINKKPSLKLLIKLNRYINKNKIHVLHVHLIEAEIYVPFLKILNPKLKIIITKHNANDFRKKLHWRLIGKLVSLFVNKIICVSKEIKKFSCKYEFINKRRIIVFPNGIDTKNIRKNINSNKRKKLGLSSKDFIIGVVGRLTKQKGHIFMIKAAEILKKKIPNLKVLVIGDGELEKSLKLEVKKRRLNQFFIFLGFRKDTLELYSIMDILCMPSLWEGLSLVLLEAMSTENLVVMSDLPNNKEVARSNKEGVYFKKGDYNELAEKIYYYYKNPKKSEIIKKGAMKKVVRDFDFRKNLHKIEDMYESMVK